MAKNKTPQVPPMDAEEQPNMEQPSTEQPNMEQPSTEQPNMEQPKAEPKKVKLTLTREDVKAEPQFPLGFEEDFNEHLKNAANQPFKTNPNQFPPELMELVDVFTFRAKDMRRNDQLFSLYIVYLKKGYTTDEAVRAAKSAHEEFQTEFDVMEV